MSWFSSHVTNNPIGGALVGGGIMGPLGAAFGATGGFGGGGLFGGAPSIDGVPLPSWAQDQKALQGEEANQQGLANSYEKQLQSTLGSALTKRRKYAMNELSTRQEGEALRENYNRLGLLNSGAFNQGLANNLGNFEQQDISTLANAMAGAQGQEFGIQSELGQAGLQRQFGLEDLSTNVALQRALGNAQLQGNNQNAKLGLFGNILGGGLSALGGGFLYGGGGGGGGGGLPNGVAPYSSGNPLSLY